MGWDAVGLLTAEFVLTLPVMGSLLLLLSTENSLRTVFLLLCHTKVFGMIIKPPLFQTPQNQRLKPMGFASKTLGANPIVKKHKHVVKQD